ncbi:MAG TPA: hypothetical protein VFN01_03955 [Marinobacter sp.]|uniref:hypothetical protein n=1 Tax=Marinobacter sp. TaxID=50741 RepID=UPI002D7EEF17|nr:hypothetical protein [Marinobacter sp.]HET8800317.1 hypothetical protein [Marinobacter sp.]
MISHYPELNDHSTLTNGSAFSLGGALATWNENQADDRISFLNSYLPQATILEFSHQSLLIAPDNELYGLNAPLQRCLEPNNLSPEACRQLPLQLSHYIEHITILR